VVLLPGVGMLDLRAEPVPAVVAVAVVEEEALGVAIELLAEDLDAEGSRIRVAEAETGWPCLFVGHSKRLGRMRPAGNTKR